jgi:hypothetical protein
MPGEWVLTVARRGYMIEFTSPPPSMVVPLATALPASLDKRQVLLSEVAALLKKQAIVRVFPPFRKGFWSTFFLAPKKTNDWRPILNLKPLNKCIKPARFRMETLVSVLRCPIKNKWAASLDLKDAYLHVPILPADQRWLRFQVQGQTFEFVCLPFGLSTAPRVFTLMVRAVVAYLRRRGVNLCTYLDDWLVYGETRLSTLNHLRLVVREVQRLGFVINGPKSSFIPTQLPLYLGAQLDLVKGRAVPSPQRRSNLVACARVLKDAVTAPVIVWLKVLGLMASMVDLVPLCRFHMRPTQIHLLAYYKPLTDPLSKQVPLSDIIRAELSWWVNPANLSVGTEFPVPPFTHVVTTDASKTGWGGHWRDRQASGTWSSSEATAHINLLELWGVTLTLQAFREDLFGQRVVVQSDNSTVVSYINREGGTRSPTLCLHTRKLLLWCQAQGVVLKAIHIPGKTNILADELSRGWTPTEWSLAPHIAQTIFAKTFYPTIDLFATRHNKQLPVYCTRSNDLYAYAVDALTIDWSGMTAYAFPPVSLLPRVVEKIGREDCRVLLIAPYWPKHLWFRPLVDLITDPPILLPEGPDLLRVLDRYGDGRRVTLQPEHLQLTAWRLSGIAAERKAFRKGLLNSLPQVEGTRRSEHILSVWVPTINGAETEVALPLERL